MATDIEPDVFEGELIEQESGSANRANQGMLQVRGSYATAVTVQKPRDINAVSRRLEQESDLAGASFYYGWSVGRDRIEGPSIGLAMAAARCWGNCAIEQAPMQETADSWVFTSIFVDLETGFTLSRQFRQSKRWTVAGKLDAERKDDVRFQIGQSKAARNVILKALPEWLIDRAMDAAKAGVRTKIEELIKAKGLPAAVDAAVKALGKVGVTEAAIIDKCGVAAVSGLDVDHLVILKGDLSAIQSGQERAEALFPALAPKAEPGSKARASDLNNRLNHKPSQQPDPEQEFTHAEPEEQLTVGANKDFDELLIQVDGNLKAATDLTTIENTRKWAIGRLSRPLTEDEETEVNRRCDEARDRVKANRGSGSNKQGTLMDTNENMGQ